MTDYKQLCVELLSELENAIRVICGEDGTRHINSADAVITKARAALAEPEPEGPTVMEIIELADEIEAAGLGQVDLVRTALARWGNHTESPDSSAQPS